MKFKKNARLFRLMAVFIALSLLIAPDAFSFSGSFDSLKHQSALFPVGLPMFNRFNLLLDELSLPNPVNAARKKQTNVLQYSDDNKKKENVLSAENKRIETNITVLAVGEIDFAINISQGEWNQDLLGKTNGLCTIIPQTSGNQLQCQGTVGDKIFMVDFTIASGEEFLVQLFSGTALALMPSTISGNRADDKLEPDTQAMNQMKQLFLEQQREYSKVRQSIKIRERLLKRKNNWKSKNDEVKKVAQRTKFLNGENIFIKGDESDPDHQGHSIKFKMPEQVFVSVNGTVLELGEQYQGVLPPGIVLIPIDSKTAKTDSGATPNNQDWKNRPVPSTHTCGVCLDRFGNKIICPNMNHAVCKECYDSREGVCPTCRTRCDAKTEEALQMNLDRQLSNAKFKCTKCNGQVEGLVNLNKHQCQKQVLEDTCSQQTSPLEFTALCPGCQESIREAPEPLSKSLSEQITYWVSEITKSYFGPEGDSRQQQATSELIYTLANNNLLFPRYLEDLRVAGSLDVDRINALEVLSDGSLAYSESCPNPNLVIRNPEGVESRARLYPDSDPDSDSDSDEDGVDRRITRIIDFPPGFLLVDDAGGLSIGPEITRLDVLDEGVPDGNAVSSHACAIDENRFAMASGNDILIWTVNRLGLSRTCKSILTGHEDSVSALIKLPRGQLASGGSDGKIMIWDVSQTSPVHTLTGHGGQVTSLAAVSDSLLASGDSEGNLMLWNVDQGRLCDTLKAHENKVSLLLSLPDGRLMSVSRYPSVVTIWRTIGRDWKKFSRVTVLPLSRNISNAVVLGRYWLAVNMDSDIELWGLYQPEREASDGAIMRHRGREKKHREDMQEDFMKMMKRPDYVRAATALTAELKKKHPEKFKDYKPEN